jgi:hypothetical protein
LNPFCFQLADHKSDKRIEPLDPNDVFHKRLSTRLLPKLILKSEAARLPDKLQPLIERVNKSITTRKISKFGISQSDVCDVKELMSYKVPPPKWKAEKKRGRPSKALIKTIERWGKQ